MFTSDAQGFSPTTSASIFGRRYPAHQLTGFEKQIGCPNRVAIRDRWIQHDVRIVLNFKSVPSRPLSPEWLIGIVIQDEPAAVFQLKNPGTPRLVVPVSQMSPRPATDTTMLALSSSGIWSWRQGNATIHPRADSRHGTSSFCDWVPAQVRAPRPGQLGDAESKGQHRTRWSVRHSLRQRENPQLPSRKAPRSTDPPRAIRVLQRTAASGH
jgi:hypothetical protein